MLILFRSLNLTYDNMTTFQGLMGRRYVGDNKMLDNGTNVPSRKCYCADGNCEPSGVLNISSCKFGAPAFVSMPHFYLADPSYANMIVGMKPEKKKHDLSIVIEPVSNFTCVINTTRRVRYFIIY